MDLDDAREGLTAARALLADGSAALAAERAGAAATLATLPFLPDHEGEWVDGIRRELATIAGRALEVEARALATTGEAGASAAAAERLVLLEPFNEAAHQLRIRLLGEAGDRAGAVTRLRALPRRAGRGARHRAVGGDGGGVPSGDRSGGRLTGGGG